MTKRFVFLSVIFIFFSYHNLFGVFATVNKWGTKIYKEKENEKEVISELIPGMVVSTKKFSTEDKIEITYNGKKGWVYKSNIVIYNNVFSEVEAKSFAVTNYGENLYFYFKGNLNKFNIAERKILKRYKIGFVNQILPSTKEGLFLLEGVCGTDGEEIHNLLLYEYDSNKKVYIGSFDKNFVSIESLMFLKDSEYLTIRYKAQGKRFVAIYKTINGDLVSYAIDALGCYIFDDIVVFYNEKRIWFLKQDRILLNSSYSDDKKLLNVEKDWLWENELILKMNFNELFIETKKGVLKYDFNKKELFKSDYVSLNFNADKSLNFYEKRDREYIKDLQENKIYPVQDGVDFQFFVETNYVALGKFGKMNTFFLFSKKAEEIYRYKAIDRIDFLLPNGVLGEINFESNICFLIIEDPIKKRFFPYFIKE